jgi:hypothetical protein
MGPDAVDYSKLETPGWVGMGGKRGDGGAAELKTVSATIHSYTILYTHTLAEEGECSTQRS